MPPTNPAMMSEAEWEAYQMDREANTPPSETRQIESLLYQTMEGDCVRSLIAGNDTQCFTTQQYVDARDRWIANFTGSTRQELGLEPDGQYLVKTARKQLLASQLVVEVRPEVWTLKESDHAD